MTLEFEPVKVEETAVYRVPTDQPEADGTLSWCSTTMPVVRVRSGPHEGIGWTYSSGAAKYVIDELLTDVVDGCDPMAVSEINEAMTRTCRNVGRSGVAACAISAMDIALWDLKARLLDIPLADLFGRVNENVPIYGSGGFTTYSDETTVAQIETWVGEWDIPRMKIKIAESRGSNSERDIHRVSLARKTAGDAVELYVDANGGYERKQAIRLGRRMNDSFGVVWFEEPVSSDDLAGLREVRDQCRADVAAGEYGFTPWYFADMLEAGAVDCLQADVTRCGGYTAWMEVAHLCAAHHIQISGHCAPNLHAHIAASVSNLRHVEYFHDHHRIETELFEGAISPLGGSLRPDRSNPGHGLELRSKDAEQFRI